MTDDAHPDATLDDPADRWWGTTQAEHLIDLTTSPTRRGPFR